MTTAQVRTPSATPASPVLRGAAGARLIWLHLRSRRAPAAVLALAVCGAALRAALHWHWMFTSGNRSQQLPMIIAAGAASAIVVTTHSPFGEPERSASRWLPYLRLGTALTLSGLAIGALQLAVTGASLDGGVLQLSRNVIGMTGIGLLCSLLTGGLLAWTLPLGYVAFAEYALLEAWNNPWAWPVRPRTTAAPGSAPAWSTSPACSRSPSAAPAPASPTAPDGGTYAMPYAGAWKIRDCPAGTTARCSTAR